MAASSVVAAGDWGSASTKEVGGRRRFQPGPGRRFVVDRCDGHAQGRDLLQASRRASHRVPSVSPVDEFDGEQEGDDERDLS